MQNYSIVFLPKPKKPKKELVSLWFLFYIFILTLKDFGEPLGLESGTIQDDQLSSSSSSYPGFEPFKARLNSGAAWCMQENSYSEYLQIDLRTPHVIQQVCSALEGLCLVLNCQEQNNWREGANFICRSKRTNHIRRIPRQSLGKTIAEKTDQSGARFYIKFSWQIKYLLIWVPF